MPINSNPYQNNMYNPQVQQFSPYGSFGTNYYPQQRQDPVQQQYQQVAPQIQMPNQFSLSGKIVPTMEVITANDVPMDGSVAIFPKQDMSEIYAKQWNADGTIRTVVFKPSLDGRANNLSGDKEKSVLDAIEEVRSGFDARLNELVSEIYKLEQTICDKSIKTSTNRSTKSKNSSTLADE